MIEMLRHALRMLLNLSLLLLATLTLLFFLVRLAGDPALILSGESSDPAVLEEIRRSLGLDQPLYRQYLIFLWQAVQLDLGTSWVSGQDALALALERLWPTLTLALAAIVLHLSLSIPLGAFLGATRSSIGVIREGLPLTGWIGSSGTGHSGICRCLDADPMVCRKVADLSQHRQ